MTPNRSALSLMPLPPSIRRGRRPLAVLLAPILLVFVPTSDAYAQRGKARIEWKGREFAIEYGAVRLGSHSLAALPVGGTWRLGNNNATSLVTRVPVQSGDSFIAPGGYKLSLQRASENQFALLVARAGFALGDTRPGVTMTGVYSETEKSAGALEIACDAEPADKKETSRPFDVRIRFGKHAVAIPAVLHGVVTAPGKTKGFAVDVFSIPANVVTEREKTGRATPIASLTKKGKKGDPDSWNVILAGTAVSIVPAPVAPTANFGFGAIPDDQADPAEQALVRTGVVEWAPAQAESAVVTLVRAAAGEDGGISLVLACGARTMTLTLPDPTQKPKSIRR